MNAAISEDADVPTLAVKGLTEATRNALQSGVIVVVRGRNLLKLTQHASAEVIREVPGRKKVAVRTKRIKR